MRLFLRRLHDVDGDALHFDVHLERRDALGVAGDLEVHVAERVFRAQDVGEDDGFELFTTTGRFRTQNKTHGDASNLPANGRKRRRGQKRTQKDGTRKINAVNIHAALDRSLGELTNQPILLFERLRGGE